MSFPAAYDFGSSEATLSPAAGSFRLYETI